jgi:hypothetical protein
MSNQTLTQLTVYLFVFIQETKRWQRLCHAGNLNGASPRSTRASPGNHTTRPVASSISGSSANKQRWSGSRHIVTDDREFTAPRKQSPHTLGNPISRYCATRRRQVVSMRNQNGDFLWTYWIHGESKTPSRPANKYPIISDILYQLLIETTRKLVVWSKNPFQSPRGNRSAATATTPSNDNRLHSNERIRWLARSSSRRWEAIGTKFPFLLLATVCGWAECTQSPVIHLVVRPKLHQVQSPPEAESQVVVQYLPLLLDSKPQRGIGSKSTLSGEMIFDADGWTKQAGSVKEEMTRMI